MAERLIIQQYHSETSGNTPPSLAVGQFGINVADGILFVGNGGDTNLGVDGQPVLPLPPAGFGWQAFPLGDAGGTVTNVTGVAPIQVANGDSTPQITISQGSTLAPGAVQLTDSTTVTSSDLALSATGAKNLQDQINALSVSSNLTFAGTIDGSTGLMVTVTAEGATANFQVGVAMPAPVAGNAEYFAIVTVAGTMTPPGGAATATHAGDWWLSTGTAYQLIDSGQPDPSIPNATITGKGAIVTGTAASTPTALPVGSNGQVLYACSSTATGLMWAALPTTPRATPSVFGTVQGYTCFGFSPTFDLISSTSLGCGALQQGTALNGNVAIGSCTLRILSSGCYNTAIGDSAGSNNFTGGSCNVLVGRGAGLNLETASSNVLVGTNAAVNNMCGSSNVVVGNGAGDCIVTTSCNVFIGPAVSPNPTTGCQLAIGFGANYWLTGTSTNAIKPGAGIIDCANSCGTAGQVLMSNGSNAICWATPAAAPAATSTTLGTVYGRQDAALTNSTALGYEAMQYAGSCLGNTAIGSASMCYVAGGQNTAVGYASARVLDTGTCNVAFGAFAGADLDTGSNNILIGYGAGSSTGICLAKITTESNRIIVGNTAHTCAQIQVAWTVTSDERDKAIDPAGVPYGLAFVNQIDPIAYRWCNRSTGEVTEDRVRYGFSAQNICALETATAQPVIVSADDPEKLMFTDQMLLPVMVNAIKELSSRIEALEDELKTLKAAG